MTEARRQQRGVSVSPAISDRRGTYGSDYARFSWDLRWTYAFGFVRFSLGPRKDAYRISGFRTGFPDFVPQNGFVD